MEREFLIKQKTFFPFFDNIEQKNKTKQNKTLSFQSFQYSNFVFILRVNWKFVPYVVICI